MCRVHRPTISQRAALRTRSAALRTPTFLYRAHARARETEDGTGYPTPLEMITAVGPGPGGLTASCRETGSSHALVTKGSTIRVVTGLDSLSIERPLPLPVVDLV
jgi:hypothetical protein